MIYIYTSAGRQIEGFHSISLFSFINIHSHFCNPKLAPSFFSFPNSHPPLIFLAVRFKQAKMKERKSNIKLQQNKQKTKQVTKT